MITIRGVKLGAGIPKICVPIVESNEESIIKEALRVREAVCQIVEWRMDFFDEVFDFERVLHCLAELKKVLGNEKLLLATFRTKEEGGQKSIIPEIYQVLIERVIESKLVDLVDVELFMGDNIFKKLAEKAKSYDCHIIASNHDFDKTPECDDIVGRLIKMNELGADICKIAVMPKNMEDVATLLKATSIMKDKHDEITVVTMSMGKLGMISRIAGEFFGSAITFGIIDKPSAPGQIEINRLQEIMQNISEL